MRAMKNQKLNIEVRSRLAEFDRMESISPSEEWNQSMLSRLNSVKPISGSGIIPTRYKVLVLIAILTNVGILWSSIIIESKTDKQLTIELQIISNEFLVNPISINN